MKNIRILTITLFALLTIILAACDGVIPADLELDLQASGQSRGVEDTNYKSASLDSNGSFDDSSSSSNEVRFKGMVGAVTANTITLNGVTFSVDTQEDLTTLFTAGSVFEIEYRLGQDGTITITQFHPEDGSSDYDVEFKGLVEAVTANTLTLNSQEFSVATGEDLTALFAAGQPYEIKYIINEDGTITIVDFHSEDGLSGTEDESDDYDVEFKGMVENVTANTLTLNSQELNVTTDQDLSALFVAGQLYEIKYIFNEDGSITIVDFHSEDEDDDLFDDSSDDWDDDSSDDSNDNNNNDDNNDNDNNNDSSNNGNDDSTNN